MLKVKRNRSVKRNIIIIASLIVVFIGVYALVAYFMHLFPFAASDSRYEPGTHIINNDKTDTEKRSIDDLTKNPGDKTKNEQTDTPPVPQVDTNSGKQKASVLITNINVADGMVSASGFVTNVIESDGSCVYTFSSGSNIVTKSSNVLPNPSSTTCETVKFPTGELSAAGTWSVVLSYTSPQSAGISSAKELRK